MKYDFFLLLKEAHSHGRDCIKLWDEEKSFEQFLMQYNLIKEYNNYRNRATHPEIAKGLRKKGYSVRYIAKILGYKNPGSITHLLNKKP